MGNERNASAVATAQSSTGMRSTLNGRPNVAMAGAMSETFVVHDTNMHRPSSVTASKVMRVKFNSPPRPSSTEPTVISGLPAPRAAVSAPKANSSHNHHGMVGSTPRLMRANRSATSTSTPAPRMGTQPGKNVSSTDSVKTTSSLVPAHNSWMGDVPGTGRSRTTGRR